MIVDVPLKGIVGAFADVDAAECSVEVFGDLGTLRTLQVLTVCGLDIRGHLIQRQTEAQQRCVADHDHLGKLLGGRGITRQLRGVRFGRERGLRQNACDHHCARQRQLCSSGATARTGVALR